MDNADFLTLLGGLGVVRDFKTNDIIYMHECSAQSIFLIHEGKVKHIFYDDEGEEKTFLIVKEGEIFGEITYFQQDQGLVISQALSPCKIEFIDVSDFKDVLEQKPEIYILITKLLTKKMRIVMSQIKDMAFKSAEGRLANLLLRLVDQHGKYLAPNRTLIDLIVTQQELGNMISVYRSTVSKLLVKMKNQGLIDIKNKKISILDSQGLLEIGLNPRRKEPRPIDA